MDKLIIFEDSSKVEFGGGQKGTLDVIEVVEKYLEITLFDTNRKSRFQKLTYNLKKSYLYAYGNQKNIGNSSFSVGITEIIFFPILVIINYFKILFFLKFKKYKNFETVLYTSSKKNLFFLYLLKLSMGYKYIYHARTLDNNKSIWFKILKIILRKCDLVICVSESVKKNLDIETGKVLYNTINIPKKANPYHFELDDVFKIGFVGELLDWKGIDLFGNLSELFDPNKISFHAYGGGKNLKELSFRFPKVMFHDFVKEHDDIFQNINLIINPSISPESFGRSTLEAAAYGIPCISSNFGGQRELIQEGKFGILSNPGDLEEFQKLIEKIYHDEHLYKELSENGKIYSKKFSKKNFSKSLINLISEI